MNKNSFTAGVFFGRCSEARHSKKVFLKKGAWILSIQLLLSHFSTAQNHQNSGSFVPDPDRTRFHLILTINSEDGFYLKRDINDMDYVTYVHGEKVLGSPYLFPDWLAGTITTADGRYYQYPLRYNAYGQVVSFANGTDSLDVTDEIREFTLSQTVHDTSIMSRFINANQFGKEKTTFFYEVVFDCPKGELLKSFQKNISTFSGGLLASKGTKYFDLQTSFSYYDKTRKKIFKINGNYTKLSQFLQLPGRDAQSLDRYDLSKEEDIISFIKSYCSY